MKLTELLRKLPPSPFVDSPTIRFEDFANGSFSAHFTGKIPNVAGGGATSYLCKITGTSGDGYLVDIYGDGYDAPKTGTGFAQPLQILLFEALPIGTKVLCNSVNLTITGNGSGL